MNAPSSGTVLLCCLQAGADSLASWLRTGELTMTRNHVSDP
jgi:hypothetical protein